jgi:lipoyl(octanoyl) transferase
MQVRHGLTSHGFAINITKEPIPWFDQVIACGLADVKAESVESVKQIMDGRPLSQPLNMKEEMYALANIFGDGYKRSIRTVREEDGEVWEYIKEMEDVAEKAGGWPKGPITS